MNEYLFRTATSPTFSAAADPRSQGTRITVYDIVDYQRMGRSAERTAGYLRLTVPQVQAAVRYIDAHQDEVAANYRRCWTGPCGAIRRTCGQDRRLTSAVPTEAERAATAAGGNVPRRTSWNHRDAHGLPADADARGHFEALMSICRSADWGEFWTALGVPVLAFEDVGLPLASGVERLEDCQDRGLLLVTGNRNAGAATRWRLRHSATTVASLPVWHLCQPRTRSF